MTTEKENQALVVLSGGQDSATCLGLAIHTFGAKNVHAICFDYGQRHRVEIDCARELCEIEDTPLKIVELNFLGDLVTSALTGSLENVGDQHPGNTDLPASFVPNRNALFLTIAHAHAQEIGANTIYTGVCQTDYSGYPDCRREFIQHMERALNTGYCTEISIRTPLMDVTKAHTFLLAHRIGYLDKVLAHSHTCYEGDHETSNGWGYGCGECPACQLRKKGYEEYLALKAKSEC